MNFIKKQVFLLMVMSALLIVIKGQELSCLTCEGIYDPKLCKRVKDCKVGERCGTQKINNEFGEYVFNLGCLSEKVCESYLPVNDTESTNTCYECCETNLCNLNGCGTTGYPTERPPVCYGCSQLTPSGQCHDIDTCSDGEVCSIIGMMMFDVPTPVFETRCLNRDLCARHVNTTNRSKRSNEQQICEACCSQDLCNKDCRVTETSLDDANEPTDCYDIYKRKKATNTTMIDGIYNVTTWKTNKRIQVLCKSGWTVFQKRFDGLVNFTRNFSDYKQGFGDINGEFWLGLELIREMTSKSLSVLNIVYSETEETMERAFFNFSLGGGDGFTLHIDAPMSSYDYNDPIEYKFNEYHDGQKFSTFDHDVDSDLDRNCAQEYRGGWWYNNCTLSNLNGEYDTSDNKTRMTFADFVFEGSQIVPNIFNLRISEMMFSEYELFGMH